MRNFGLLSSIRPEDPSTWEGKAFLTFDLDWVADSVLERVIERVEALGLPATWFVTHDTPLLARLRSNAAFELGIHPNFNGLLGLGQGEAPSAGAREVVATLQALVPEATAVRSHSLTQSSRLLSLFHEVGLTHDANHFVPARAQVTLRPWRHHNGLVRVPHLWEDDLDALMGEERQTPRALLDRGGLLVAAFHPIHVFLNTHDMATYERTRPLHGDAAALSEHVHQGPGTATFLAELVAAASA